MKPVLQTTADGSITLSNSETGVLYHSIHGAVTESKHVFIQAGLQYYFDRYQPQEINICEMGFGTGLNAYLTIEWLKDSPSKINYQTIEKYPLSNEVIKEYASTSKLNDPFLSLHEAEWNQWVEIQDNFRLLKHHNDLKDVSLQDPIDIVYYDAFAPTAQPELWTEEVFQFLKKAMKPQSVLVTYCAKGIVKRALRAVGFEVENLPGPPRKREMIRAVVK